MCINHTEQPQIEIKVEAKQSADQWRSSFNATSKYMFPLISISCLFLLVIAIEKMTAKTGNFKAFDVFVNMLENAINQVRFVGFR